jgi:hypothetical protein
MKFVIAVGKDTRRRISIEGQHYTRLIPLKLELGQHLKLSDQKLRGLRLLATSKVPRPRGRRSQTSPRLHLGPVALGNAKGLRMDQCLSQMLGKMDECLSQISIASFCTIGLSDGAEVQISPDTVSTGRTLPYYVFCVN